MTRIIIFAKAPQPGLAKTRLIPALGAEGAAALAREMLYRTVTAAIESGLGPVELCMDPQPADQAWLGVELPPSLGLSAQSHGDLGARMASAAFRRLDKGPVILIGTDCVEMNKGLLKSAAVELTEADAVINPCVDGGYALLGLRRFDARVFEDIDWSTSSVSAQTLARFRALGWRVHVGQAVHDVDNPADLDYWQAYKS